MTAEPSRTDAGFEAKTGEMSNGILVAEAGGAGLLTFAITATGILSERHAIGDTALALGVTALAGACTFFVLARILAPFIAGYFNPAFTLALVMAGRLRPPAAMICASAQIMGAMLGVMAAHLFTNTGVIQTASQVQTGASVWLGEALASALFIFIALATIARSRALLPLTGAICLLIIAPATPSISFANPAVTLARSLTESFTAIALTDAVIIAIIQLIAVFGGCTACHWLNKAGQPKSR
jgi:glycerol uptake facilitator-like aquaporin